MSDRIDQMTHEELKAATRRLVSVWDADPDTSIRGEIEFQAAIDALRPTTLDKVRELLKAEGWENQAHQGDVRIEIWPGDNKYEIWTKP